MNTAEYLIKKLEEFGINDFFGVPGDYNFEILNAIESNSTTNWIGCTNELNAGYSADGYARERGFGAVVTTYGVGELSAINAIAGSYSENVPVISIVGIPNTFDLENKTLLHHNFFNINTSAYVQSYKSVVETTTVLSRDNAKLEIDRVLKTFLKERRPVYIAIPIDVAKMDISDREFDYSWTSDEETLKHLTELIIEKIHSSKLPIILADCLINRFDSTIEFKEFVEKSGIPVTNFLMGTNIVEQDYKLNFGTYFSKFKNPTTQKYLENTDCLIAVGAIYNDLNAFGFNLPYKINSQIAIYGTYTYIDGIRYDNVKMSELLNSLSKNIEKTFIDIEKPEIGFEKYENPPAGNLTSNYIYSRLQDFVKENDIVVAETGTVLHGISQMKFPQNVKLHTQALWGSIGRATPATFGISVANPNSRVILISGEGAHQVTAMELGSMLKMNLKPVIIVINNNGYSIERVLSNEFNAKYNDVVQMNYTKFARAFEGEVWATKVSTSDEFDKALKVTQIMNKLCYIEACIDCDDILDLTKKYVVDLKQKQKEQEYKIPVKKQDSIKNIPQKEEKVAKEDNTSIKLKKFSFETIVHTSLKDIGE